MNIHIKTHAYPLLPINETSQSFMNHHNARLIFALGEAAGKEAICSSTE